MTARQIIEAETPKKALRHAQHPPPQDEMQRALYAYGFRWNDNLKGWTFDVEDRPYLVQPIESWRHNVGSCKYRIGRLGAHSHVMLHDVSDFQRFMGWVRSLMGEAESPKKALRAVTKATPYIRVAVRMHGEQRWRPAEKLRVEWHPGMVSVGHAWLAGLKIDATPRFGLSQDVWDYLVEIMGYNIMEGGGGEEQYDDWSEDFADLGDELDLQTQTYLMSNPTGPIEELRYQYVGDYERDQEAATTYGEP